MRSLGILLVICILPWPSLGQSLPAKTSSADPFALNGSPVVDVSGGRKTDLTRYPYPTMALAGSIVLPGGGWFFLAGKRESSGDDVVMGLLALAASSAAVAFAIQSSRKNDSAGFRGAMIGFGLVRALDIWAVTGAATERMERLTQPAMALKE